jgi:osmotically-inducible protein OsmY
MPKVGSVYTFSLPGKDKKMLGELVKETPNNYHLRVMGQKTVKVVPKEVLKGKRPMSKESLIKARADAKIKTAVKKALENEKKRKESKRTTYTYDDDDEV